MSWSFARRGAAPYRAVTRRSRPIQLDGVGDGDVGVVRGGHALAPMRAAMTWNAIQER